RREILAAHNQCPRRRQHLAERAGEVPAATELMQERVEGVTGRQVRLARQADAAIVDDDAEALLCREALCRFAELLCGIFADQDRRAFLAGGWLSRDNPDFGGGDALKDLGEIPDRLAQAAAMSLGLVRAPAAGFFRSFRRVVHDARRNEDRRLALAFGH